MSSVSNIYRAVGDFYGWQNMPETSGTFWGFPGMTRDVLESAIEALQANACYLNFENDSKENRDFWFNEAYKDLQAAGKTGGAPREGFTKWFNWLYVAAAGNKSIKDFFGGKPYSFTEYAGEVIGKKLAQIGETVEYGLKQPAAIPDLLQPTKANFYRWVIIGGVLLFVGKKFKLI